VNREAAENAREFTGSDANGDPRKLSIATVTWIYALGAALWMPVSDWALDRHFGNAELIAHMRTLRDWLFVAVTAIILYAILRLRTKRNRAAAALSAATPAGAESHKGAVAPVALLIVVIVAITTAAIYFRFSEIQQREAALLEAFAESRAHEVSAWLHHRMSEMEFIRSSALMADLYRNWREHADLASGDNLMKRIAEYRAANEFADALVLDERGEIVARESGYRNERETPPELKAAALRALATGLPQRTAIYYRDGATPNTRLDFVAPLAQSGKTARAAVALRIDPALYLFPLLKNWPRDALGGQTTLVWRAGDRVSILSEIREHSGPPTVQRQMVSALGATADAGGRGKAINTIDYRGVPVLGVARAVADSDWLIVAKIERAAIVAATVKDATWIVLTGLIATFATLLLGAFYRERAALRIAAIRHEEQAARLQSLQLLKAIAESSTDVIYAQDRDGRYIFFNREACRVTGKPYAEVIGNDDNAIFPRDQADSVKREHLQVMAEGKAITFEKMLSTVDGDRYFMSIKGPLCDDGGSIIGSYGISRDVTERKLVEEQRAYQAALLTSVHDSISEQLAVLNSAGDIVAVNAAWRNFAMQNGETADAPAPRTDVGMNYLEVCRAATGGDHAQAMAACAGIQSILDGASNGFTLEYACHSPTVQRWFLLNATPLKSPRGGAVVVHTNITERKRAEEMSAYLAAIVAGSSDAIVGRSIDRKILTWNRAAEKLFGYKAAEIIGRSFSLLVPPDREDESRHIRESVAKGASFVDVETVRVAKDGQRIDVSLNASPIYDEQGAWLGVALILRDIRERKRAEHLQNEQARVLELIATGASLAQTLEAVARGIESLAADVLCSILIADETGAHLRHGTAPSLPPEYNSAVDGIAIGYGIGSCGTAAFLRREVIVEDILDHEFWRDFVPLAAPAGLRACWSTPIFDAMGKLLGSFAIYRRETGAPSAWHRQLIGVATHLASICIGNARAAAALRQSEARLRLFVEHAPAAIAMLDRDMRYLAVSRRWTQDYRISERDLLGVSHYEIFPDLPYAWREIHQRCLAGAIESADEDPFPRADGTVDWVRWEIRPWHDDNGAVGGILLFSEIITERVVAAQQLRKLSSAVEQSLNGIMITDVDARVEYVNDAFSRVSGYSREQVLGRNPRLLSSGRTPPETYAAMWAALSRGEAWKGEFINRRRNGEEYTEFVHISPIRCADGPVTHYLGIREDVTERKRIGEELDRHRHHLEELVEIRTHALAQTNTALNAEIVQRTDAEAEARRLNERLQTRTRALERAMKNLEAFSYSVSHDLRAPLRAVSGYAGMLARSEAEHLTADGRRMLGRIKAGAQKMDCLILDILEYSRVERIQRKDTRVDMTAIAAEVAHDLQAAYPQATFTLGELPDITADATMAQQILSNLIGNAFKFSARRADARVEVGASEVNGVPEFFVRDNGAGFDQRYAGKLFGLFQRMHGEQEFSGSGVGLAVVKRLVEHHGGRISAESIPGGQTTFRFTLAPEPSAAPAV
jgi:PAS domain S-box-containing protein